jgi:hypothetical protein
MAKGIPEPLLFDLTEKVRALDPRAVGSTMAARAREIAEECVRWDDATDFVRALDAELQVFIDEPVATGLALAELERRERARMH